MRGKCGTCMLVKPSLARDGVNAIAQQRKTRKLPPEMGKSNQHRNSHVFETFCAAPLISTDKCRPKILLARVLCTRLGTFKSTCEARGKETIEVKPW